MSKRIDYHKIQAVLVSPKEILPYQSEDDAKLLLIELLRAYKKRLLDFQTLVTATEGMRYYTSPATQLWEILKRIQELNKEYRMMEKVLGDILKDLQKETL